MLITAPPPAEVLVPTAQDASPQIVNVPASAVSGGGVASPSAVLQGARAQRSELRNQVERLQETRNDITRELNSSETPSSTKPGLELRLKSIDARIEATEVQLAAADQAVAVATAVPGADVQPPRPPRQGPPEEVFIVPMVFTIFVLFPIAVAYARRIWRRGATVIAPVPQEVRDRLEQLGQSVESIALEVERIGEGQRFMTKVMSESGRALGAGAAQPIQVAQGERVGVRHEG